MVGLIGSGTVLGDEAAISETDAEASRCIERSIVAMQELRQKLEQREETLRLALNFRSEEFDEAFRTGHVDKSRTELEDALTRLEECRREARISSIRSALAHGMSINDIARLWGFSRQMASRYAKAARGEV